MRHKLTFFGFCFLAASTLVSAGCSSLSKIPAPFDRTGSTPARSTAVWSPASRVVNGTPQRGFAGRVMFYNNKSKHAIKVDGEVVVFAYDEYPGRSVSNNTPEKTYPFLAEDLKKLHTKNENGHSYNFWVPWDTKGAEGERKTISLIVKFVPKDGSSPVVSGQAKCTLPGKESPEVFADTTTSNLSGDISLVGYQGEKYDRFGNRLPEGYRDWTKDTSRFGKEWCSIAEERAISSGNRPLRMSTTTISVPNSPKYAKSQPVIQQSTPQNPAAAPASIDPRFLTAENLSVDPRFLAAENLSVDPRFLAADNLPVDPRLLAYAQAAQQNVPPYGNAAPVYGTAVDPPIAAYEPLRGYDGRGRDNRNNATLSRNASLRGRMPASEQGPQDSVPPGDFENTQVRYSPSGYPVPNEGAAPGAYDHALSAQPRGEWR